MAINDDIRDFTRDATRMAKMERRANETCS